MFAVGRLGSYITRGVNTVSGPFHPFGGAVDIVVVEQQDGSFKSSPWYVRFGKFQGVLKANEKVVKISVNGVEANFHMYLDHRGGAYFLRDVDEEVDSILLSSSSGEETVGQLGIREPIESKSCNYEADLSNFISQIDVMNGNVLSRSSSQRSRILGLVFGRNSMKKDRVGRVDSLERAEIVADLLELKWSTNFTPKKYTKDSGSRFSAIDIVHDEENKDFRISDGESEVERSCLSIGTSSFGESAFEGNNDLKVNCCNSFFDDIKVLENERISVNTNSIVSETYSEMVNVLPTNNSVKELESCCVIKSSSFSHSICVDQEERSTSEEDKENMLGPVCDSREHSEAKNISPPVGDEEDQFFFGDLDAFNLEEVQTIGTISQDHTEEEEYFNSNFESNSSPDRFFEESLPNDVKGLVQKSNIISSQVDIPMKNEVAAQGVGLIVESLPIMYSHCDELGTHHMSSARDLSGENSLESMSGMDVENYVPNPMAIKKKLRVLTPTSEQLASLNLKEGKNIVSFTFSTAVMGKQQVNASIYLWRWDTRIVISDVDGTITKSDLLGQFMPLVGQDWSQMGVAHFFSAIKENGYQMLFLSARSISQAYHTRQFLINLKQDGKALPDGPVLISPDGLFPSLFREVIRRAPHEFKIGCLEDIRALFPSDRNPFYAGFGNRDSDEFSYLKVGIPKGKIFIINPKGEVVVNHRVDSKSYNSLQALVHGMFPPMFSSEQEGFNSWNYWKLPPLAIDI